MHAQNAIVMDCYKIASNGHDRHIALAGYVAGIGDPTMRMFETVTSTMLVLAAQALVVGVVVTTF
ncbi:hypothetical protein [Sphingomonas sp. 1P08PE]|uniref:hypothetical protein n=1 Tax=Sphingomonas sp. 1P08PE TaxID=554122 RepID=UPI0039A19DF6